MIYKCPCSELTLFKTRGELIRHQQQNLNQECSYACKFANCGEKFVDSVQRDFHYLHGHPLIDTEQIELVPLESISKSKYYQGNDLKKFQMKQNQAIEKFLSAEEREQMIQKNDDLISIQYRSEPRGLIVLRKKYKCNKTYAILKHSKFPNIDKTEQVIIISKLLDWLDNQNIATLYTVTDTKYYKFWRLMNFFPEYREKPLKRIQKYAQAESNQIVVSIRTKSYIQNEPYSIKFPDNLPRTALSQQLRELRDAIKQTGTDKIIESIFFQKYHSGPNASKQEAQPTDQYTTDQEVIKFVCDKTRIKQKHLWDQHRYRPDWQDRLCYNNLKEKYGNEISLSNNPYSLTAANLAWGCVNWLRGKGSIFIIPTQSLATKFTDAVVDSFGIKQSAGALKYGQQTRILNKPINFVFMLTPEHLEWIEYQKGSHNCFKFSDNLCLPFGKPGIEEEERDTRDILLRQLSGSHDRINARIAASTNINEVSKITDEDIKEYKKRSDPEIFMMKTE